MKLKSQEKRKTKTLIFLKQSNADYVSQHLFPTKCTRLDFSHQPRSKRIMYFSINAFKGILYSHCVWGPAIHSGGGGGSSASTRWWRWREPGSGTSRPAEPGRFLYSHRVPCWVLWAGRQEKHWLVLIAVSHGGGGGTRSPDNTGEKREGKSRPSAWEAASQLEWNNQWQLPSQLFIQFSSPFQSVYTE